MLTVNPAKRLTAQSAMQHPWLKKYVPAAYLSLLNEVNREADPVFYKVQMEVPLESRAPTLSRLGGKVPGTLEVESELATEAEKATELPNLVENLARKRFKKAVNAIVMTRVMSALGAKSLASRSDTTSTLSPSGTTAEDLDNPGGTGSGFPMPSELALKQAEELASMDTHGTTAGSVATLEEKVAGMSVNGGLSRAWVGHLKNFD